MKKREKLLAFIAGASLLVDHYRKFEGLYRSTKEYLETRETKLKYSVTVYEDTDVYRAINYSLMEYDKKNSPGSYTIGKVNGEPTVFMEKMKPIERWVDGHKITINFSKDEKSSQSDDSTLAYLPQSKAMPKGFISLSANSKEGLEVIEKMVRDAFHRWEHLSQEVWVRTHDASGRYWDPLCSLKNAKPLDTLILKEGLQEEIISSIDRFLDSEEYYTKRGIPYHIGFALTGPPGTGKSSLVAAMGKHLSKDVYVLNLSSIESDTSLLSLVSEVGNNILLIEDIDAQGLNLERGGNNENITLSAVLNSLDGLSTPHGLVTFITSNNIEALDPALLRPGRIDKIYELDYADDDQIRRMFQLFFGKDPGIKSRSKVTPAEITSALRMSVSYEEAVETIHQLIDSRKAIS